LYNDKVDTICIVLVTFCFEYGRNLDLIVSGNEFHRTGAAWMRVRPPNVEQLTLGTDKRKCEDERRESVGFGFHRQKIVNIEENVQLCLKTCFGMLSLIVNNKNVIQLYNTKYE